MNRNSNIKVCHICSYYENILFDNLVKAQCEETIPTVFFFKKFGRDVQYNKDYINEVNCFREIDRFFFFLKEKKAYSAFLEQYQIQSFDILFAHSLFVNGYLAYRANKQFGSPYIVMVQNTDLNVFFKYRAYLRKAGLKVLLAAESVIFASKCYRDELITKYVPKKYRKTIMDKSIIIPYGIENVFFDNKVESRALSEPVKLLSVGLICRNKNHLKLCEAVKKLRDSGIDIRLTIVGEIANNSIAKSLSNYDFITMLPYMTKPELIKEYRGSDLFALASLTETFGLVYAEALSQGLPIIYSKGQGFDGQFPEGWIGHSVNAKDVDSISSGIKMVIDDHRVLASRTEAAAEKFKWSNITRQYINLYNTIMENK